MIHLSSTIQNAHHWNKIRLKSFLFYKFWEYLIFLNDYNFYITFLSSITYFCFVLRCTLDSKCQNYYVRRLYCKSYSIKDDILYKKSTVIFFKLDFFLILYRISTIYIYLIIYLHQLTWINCSFLKHNHLSVLLSKQNWQ